jgi:hypothetical protein
MATFISTAGVNVTGTSVSRTVSVNSGDLVVVQIMEAAGSGTVTGSVSGSGVASWFGPVWEVSANTTSTVACFYGVANTTGSITATYTGSGSTLKHITVDVFRPDTAFPADPLDVGQVNESFGTSPRNTGSVTTTVATAVLCSAIGAPSGATYSGITSGWTANSTINSRFRSAYRLLSSTGTYDCEHTYGSGQTGTGIAAFVETGGGGSPSNAPRSMFYHNFGMR